MFNSKLHHHIVFISHPVRLCRSSFGAKRPVRLGGGRERPQPLQEISPTMPTAWLSVNPERCLSRTASSPTACMTASLCSQAAEVFTLATPQLPGTKATDYMTLPMIAGLGTISSLTTVWATSTGAWRNARTSSNSQP